MGGQTFVINGREYRAGLIAPERLPHCQHLGRLLAHRALGTEGTGLAVAYIICAMLAEHHPEITVTDILPGLTEDMVLRSGAELSRQLLALVPDTAMGHA